MKVQVSKDSEFRREVAEAVVNEAHPGYHGMGWRYADPVEGRIWYAEANRAWNPWPDSTLVVPVDELVSHDGNDFNGTVDWEITDISSYRSMVAAYLSSEGEEFEPNGDIPEWVKKSEVVSFARENSEEWEAELDEIEDEAYKNAVEFALGEILDEIEIEQEVYA